MWGQPTQSVHGAGSLVAAVTVQSVAQRHADFDIVFCHLRQKAAVTAAGPDRASASRPGGVISKRGRGSKTVARGAGAGRGRGRGRGSKEAPAGRGKGHKRAASSSPDRGPVRHNRRKTQAPSR